MKKTKNKLLLSVAILVMAIAITSTSTFAWFAMTSEPTIENLTVTVTTNDGMLISIVPVSASTSTPAVDAVYANPKDFKSTIKGSEITAGKTDLKLNAVTPNGTELNGNKIFTGMLGTETFVENKDYLAFDIHFLSSVAKGVSIGNNTSATSTVDIDNENPAVNHTISSPLGANNIFYDADSGAVTVGTPNETTSLKIGNTIDALAANAVRIGAHGSSTKIYNPSPDAGWSNAAKEGALAHMANAHYNALNGTAINILEKAATHVKKGEISTATSFLDLTQITSAELGDTKLYGNLYDFFGTGNVWAGTARIYIWLEGTDADCFDGLYGDTTTINLSFAQVALTQQPQA